MEFSYTIGERPIGPPGGHPEAGLLLSGDTLYVPGYIPGAEGSSVFRIGTNGLSYAIISEQLDAGVIAGIVMEGTTLFATTLNAGSNGLGTIFAVDAITGDHTQFKQFTGPDGNSPRAGLVLVDGTLYGTTSYGGDSNCGTVFRINTDGSDFAVVKHFSGGDGARPYAPLTLCGATLFGTTGAGGDFNQGTVFRINTNGTGFAVLKHFNGEDGQGPGGGVIVSGTTVYGTTAHGGAFDNGVLFRLSLAPQLIDPRRDGTNFIFSFRTIPEVSYAVESCTNLVTPVWLQQEALTGDGATMHCVMPMTNTASQFFRVRQL